MNAVANAWAVWPRWSILTLLAALVLAGCGGSGGDEAAGMPGAGEQPPPKVSLAEVSLEDVDITGEYPARVRGAREVEVRAQVSGILQERLYMEGQFVRQGVPLFTIDQRPYELALKRAQAEQANARASFNEAERNWNRIRRLFDQNAISERERDSALSQFELARAALQTAEAGVDQAELDLEYTEVHAPIAGATGLETVSEGSLIERGGLVTRITQLDPVHVRFSLPEGDSVGLWQSGEQVRPERLPATLVLPAGLVYEHQGKVNFTDSRVDTHTGTVSARAVFPNPDRMLMPGQFVRLRMTVSSLEDVAPIPAEAVAQGKDGPVVYVVDDDDVAQATAVELGPVSDGRQIVLSGLEQGDRVVVNGLAGLQDGMSVSPDESDDEADASAGGRNAAVFH